MLSIEKPKRVNDFIGAEKSLVDETLVNFNDPRSVYLDDFYGMHTKNNFVKINRYITDESTLTDEEIQELLSIEKDW